jgi:hypothetical protein
MTTRSSLATAFANAVKAYDEAKAKFNRLTLARAASAPGVTFEDVGRAAVEMLYCQTEKDDAHNDLLTFNDVARLADQERRCSERKSK